MFLALCTTFLPHLATPMSRDLQMGTLGTHALLPQLADKYGPVCKAFFGRYPIIIVTDPDLVKQVRTEGQLKRRYHW